MESILNPVQAVALSDGQVEVRQLTLLKAVEFLKRVGALAGQLFTSDGKFKLVRALPPLMVAGEGGLKPVGEARQYAFDLEAIQAAIAQSGELTQFLLIHSTRKDEAWLEKLTLAEGLTVLKIALELNLAPEILRLGNECAGVLKTLKAPASNGKRH